MLSPILEYLLAATGPSGGKLVKYGVSVTRVPVWPPGLVVTFIVYPRANAYANIQYSAAVSPAIVPGTMYTETYQAGVAIQVGFYTEVAYGEHNFWVEFTQSTPIVTRMTNMSALNQYFEVGQEYLIIDSAEDYKRVREIVARWGGVT